jgi:hypothetical protein
MATPLHVHREDDEAFYVIEGELTVYLEDSDHPTPASAGTFVHIPGGDVHAFQVDSETARWLDLTTPQHERFMRAAGEPAQERVFPPEGLIDMKKVGAAQQQYGIEILGPPLVLKANASAILLYSPNLVEEEEFSELPLYGVLRSSPGGF